MVWRRHLPMEKYFSTHNAWQPPVGSCKFPPALFPWWKKWCHDVIVSSGGPDCTLPDLGIFPHHILTSPPPLPRLEPRHTRWHPPWRQWFKSLTPTLFRGLCQHSRRAFLSCWVTPSQNFFLKKGKKLERDWGYFEHSKLVLFCFSFYYRFGIQMKFKNRKQTSCSAVMFTPLFPSRRRMNLKNVSPSP